MVKVPSFSISGQHLIKAVCFDHRQGVLALQEALGLFVLKTAGRPGSLRYTDGLAICSRLSVLTLRSACPARGWRTASWR